MIIANSAGFCFTQDKYDKHRYHVTTADGGYSVGMIRLDTSSMSHHNFAYLFESKNVSLNLLELRALAGFIKGLDKINKRNAGRGKKKSSDENER